MNRDVLNFMIKGSAYLVSNRYYTEEVERRIAIQKLEEEDAAEEKKHAAFMNQQYLKSLKPSWIDRAFNYFCNIKLK